MEEDDDDGVSWQDVGLLPDGFVFCVMLLRNHRFVRSKKDGSFGGRDLTHFVPLAAPVTADEIVPEELPVDIQVTETPEPNSRVSFCFSSSIYFFV
ncbi:hypothetical protein M569_14892 [Genlisea aurea]|uniref:Uncharacterized protein n=1 Tax=Genlisea aurea TaxID=192259 RepID=S8BZU8_9LAMI|nr:hypothetical protein M569_14892 [Genlisea aurea]